MNLFGGSLGSFADGLKPGSSMAEDKARMPETEPCPNCSFQVPKEASWCPMCLRARTSALADIAASSRRLLLPGDGHTPPPHPYGFVSQLGAAIDSSKRKVPRPLLVVALVSMIGLLTLSVIWIVRPLGPMGTKGGAGEVLRHGLDSGEFAFLNQGALGEPVRWNPCEPIRWVFNPRYAPKGALSDMRAAIERVSKATGIRFTYTGLTDEPAPIQDRIPYDVGRYGDRWAPVLVTWWPADRTDLLGAKTIGFGAPIWLAGPDGRPAYYVSAELVMSTSFRLAPGFGTPHARGVVLQHEFGHIVGLAHVQDPRELMSGHAAGRMATDWGPGDRQGLRALYGDRGCIKVPRPEPPF